MKFNYQIEHPNSYKQHRERVINATSIVDHNPPLLFAKNFCRFTKLKDDVNTYLNINKCNAKLYENLNCVARTRGIVDSFRTKENSIPISYTTKSPKFRLLDKIDYDNMCLGKRILCIKGDLDTRLHPRYIRKKSHRKSFEYPVEVLSKYSNGDIPKEPKLAKKYLRPKIWFHLEIKNVRPLGRIVMELYTEAAPQVVLEFIRLCFNKQKERINLVRLFPNLWLEGEVSLDQRTLIQKNIEYDKRTVDHGQHNGVLSFDLENINLFKQGILNFSISFKPLTVLNGIRVGFGRICHGLKVLNCIQDFGTKNGKPTKEMIVSDCGIIV